MSVIKYGFSNMLNREFGSTTVGQLTSDLQVLGALNAPEGCRALSDGEVLPSHALVANYDSITLEKQASSKAA